MTYFFHFILLLLILNCYALDPPKYKIKLLPPFSFPFSVTEQETSVTTNTVYFNDAGDILARIMYSRNEGEGYKRQPVYFFKWIHFNKNRDVFPTETSAPSCGWGLNRDPQNLSENYYCIKETSSGVLFLYKKTDSTLWVWESGEIKKIDIINLFKKSKFAQQFDLSGFDIRLWAFANNKCQIAGRFCCSDGKLRNFDIPFFWDKDLIIFEEFRGCLPYGINDNGIILMSSPNHSVYSLLDPKSKKTTSLNYKTLMGRYVGLSNDFVLFAGGIHNGKDYFPFEQLVDIDLHNVFSKPYSAEAINNNNEILAYSYGHRELILLMPDN